MTLNQRNFACWVIVSSHCLFRVNKYKSPIFFVVENIAKFYHELSFSERTLLIVIIRIMYPVISIYFDYISLRLDRFSQPDFSVVVPQFNLCFFYYNSSLAVSLAGKLASIQTCRLTRQGCLFGFFFWGWLFKLYISLLIAGGANAWV